MTLNTLIALGSLTRRTRFAGLSGECCFQYAPVLAIDTWYRKLAGGRDCQQAGGAVRRQGAREWHWEGTCGGAEAVDEAEWRPEGGGEPGESYASWVR
jgi:hypothetical protein